MGASKTTLFSPKQNQMAVLFKALGHPARIAIIEHLIQVNACICGDLVGVLPLAQPTVSRHLKELKEAGLVQGTVEGNALCYCINPNAMQVISQFLEQTLAEPMGPDLLCC